MSNRLLAVAVAAWTLVSWGGRIGLLTSAETDDPWALVRIGGSLVVGLATAGLLATRPGRADWLRWLFVGWTVALWTRSVVVTWIDPPSLAFALVHTVLGAGWFLLAWWVAPRHERHRSSSAPARP
ncbi:hypothetical protein [Salsipaludibacter albus]|uniref:hypothetical protein n=1 Tax=Salsipaludibacter albus TaxID=2849650 RepID=UPI001EE3B2EB|nr:hypothetical protein [Salsipaludibacter albus]MBY5163554.1 hypothetical protein [Salsipaludibacter albus]